MRIFRLPPCRDAHKPDDVGMELAMDHGEFAKVLVLGDQDATLLMGDPEYLAITGIGIPVPDQMTS